MQKLQQQIDDARAAANTFYNALHSKDIDHWDDLTPVCQNVWHNVVEVITERAGREDAKQLSVTVFFQAILRKQCDEIMTVIGADAELPYSELAAAVKAWGLRQYADGIIHGRNEHPTFCGCPDCEEQQILNEG